MEFATLPEAIEHAKKMADLMGAEYVVLPCSGDRPFFTCSAKTHRELYRDRNPLFKAASNG